MLEAAILVGLGAFRLSYMLSVEDGPQDIFKRLRSRLGVPDEGWVSDDLVPQLLTCVYCLSVYVVAFLGLLWLVAPWAVMLIAASSITILVHKWHEK